jgi:hypothetical protein
LRRVSRVRSNFIIEQFPLKIKAELTAALHPASIASIIVQL